MEFIRLHTLHKGVKTVPTLCLLEKWNLYKKLKTPIYISSTPSSVLCLWDKDSLQVENSINITFLESIQTWNSATWETFCNIFIIITMACSIRLWMEEAASRYGGQLGIYWISSHRQPTSGGPSARAGSKQLLTVKDQLVMKYHTGSWNWTDCFSMHGEDKKCI